MTTCPVTVTVGAYTSRYGRGGSGLRLLGRVCSGRFVARHAAPGPKGARSKSLLPTVDSPIESGAEVE
ncbi:MAG: hypothetical protein FJ167_04630 [Gammaproteobacteria bacterium]|nr:hypothetical protein [Gammaproteobacteria bacterium]